MNTKPGTATCEKVDLIAVVQQDIKCALPQLSDLELLALLAKREQAGLTEGGLFTNAPLAACVGSAGVEDMDKSENHAHGSASCNKSLMGQLQELHRQAIKAATSCC